MHQITVYQRNGKSGHSVQMSKLISFSRGLKERQSALGIWIPCCHGWKGKVTVSRLAAELGSQALLRSLQCSVYSVFPRMLGTAASCPPHLCPWTPYPCLRSPLQCHHFQRDFEPTPSPSLVPLIIISFLTTFHPALWLLTHRPPFQRYSSSSNYVAGPERVTSNEKDTALVLV